MIGIERFIAYKMTLFGSKSFTSYILKFAIIAMALSIAVMIIATSVINGFKNEISQKMFDFWGHIVINDTRASQEYDLIPIKNVAAIITELESINGVEDFKMPSLNEDGFEETTIHSGVEKVYSFSVLPAVLSTKSDLEGLLLKGVEADYAGEIVEPYLINGQSLNLSDPMSRDIVISEQTAKRMKLEVGQNVVMRFIMDEESIKKRFTIVGIYRSGLEEYDKRFAFVDHDWIVDLLGWESGTYAGLEVHIEDIDDIVALREYVYLERLPPHLFAESLVTKHSDIFQWLSLQNINEILILTLMTIVGIVNMITAFLIFTLERTTMIGLLKSQGATDWMIRKIFLLSSGFILLRGILLGVVMGISICLIQKWTGVIKLSEKEYYLSQVPIDISIPMVISIAVGSLLITLLFLILPSTIISRVSPVSALHFR